MTDEKVVIDRVVDRPYQRVALAQCTPTKFSDRDLRFYLEHFGLHAQANGWSDMISQTRLPLFLEGRAFAVYRQLDTSKTTTWQELKEEFVALFHAPEECLVWLRQFLSRTLKANEPLESLAADLRRMLSFAIPEVPLKQLDLMLKYQLLQALPRDLSQHLETHAHSLNIDQLVCKARLKTLAARKEELPIRHITSPADKGDTEVELRHQVEELKLEVQRIVYDRGNRHRNQTSCYQCGKPGHWARDCRQRRVAGNGAGPRKQY